MEAPTKRGGCIQLRCSFLCVECRGLARQPGYKCAECKKLFCEECSRKIGVWDRVTLTPKTAQQQVDDVVEFEERYGPYVFPACAYCCVGARWSAPEFSQADYERVPRALKTSETAGKQWLHLRHVIDWHKRNKLQRMARFSRRLQRAMKKYDPYFEYILEPNIKRLQFLKRQCRCKDEILSDWLQHEEQYQERSAALDSLMEHVGYRPSVAT